VHAVFYLGEIADHGERLSLPAAHELFGFAARRASAFLEAYGSVISQFGSELSAVAFARQPLRTSTDAPLFGAARFALEIARTLAEQGVCVRAAVSAGPGTMYDDANGSPAVTSTGAARVAALLDTVRSLAGNRPAFALEGASSEVASLLAHRLTGWSQLPAHAGVVVWLGASR